MNSTYFFLCRVILNQKSIIIKLKFNSNFKNTSILKNRRGTISIILLKLLPLEKKKKNYSNQIAKLP